LKSENVLKSFALIVAATAGTAAAIGYLFWMTPFGGPNPPPGADVPWSPENLRLWEALAILWSVACGSGRLVYLIFGRREEARVVKQQVGGYALFMQVIGAGLLLMSLAVAKIAGQPFSVNDLITGGIAFGLLLWATFDWFFSQADSFWPEPPNPWNEQQL
jgi:hypothetical protein